MSGLQNKLVIDYPFYNANGEEITREAKTAIIQGFINHIQPVAATRADEPFAYRWESPEKLQLSSLAYYYIGLKAQKNQKASTCHTLAEIFNMTHSIALYKDVATWFTNKPRFKSEDIAIFYRRSRVLLPHELENIPAAAYSDGALLKTLRRYFSLCRATEDQLVYTQPTFPEAISAKKTEIREAIAQIQLSQISHDKLLIFGLNKGLLNKKPQDKFRAQITKLAYAQSTVDQTLASHINTYGKYLYTHDLLVRLKSQDKKLHMATPAMGHETEFRSPSAYVDRQGNNVCHLFAIENQLDRIAQLVSIGQDINARNYAGATPLHLLVEHIILTNKPANVAIAGITRLIQLGANIQIRDEAGKNALDHMIELLGQNNSQLATHQDTLQFLINQGIDTQQSKHFAHHSTVITNYVRSIAPLSEVQITQLEPTPTSPTTPLETVESVSGLLDAISIGNVAYVEQYDLSTLSDEARIKAYNVLHDTVDISRTAACRIMAHFISQGLRPSGLEPFTTTMLMDDIYRRCRLILQGLEKYKLYFQTQKHNAFVALFSNQPIYCSLKKIATQITQLLDQEGHQLDNHLKAFKLYQSLERTLTMKKDNQVKKYYYKPNISGFRRQNEKLALTNNIYKLVLGEGLDGEAQHGFMAEIDPKMTNAAPLVTPRAPMKDALVVKEQMSTTAPAPSAPSAPIPDAVKGMYTF